MLGAHFSLVFREMWDTADLNVFPRRALKSFRVQHCGIPHLAKNERDVGHPGSVFRTGGIPRTSTLVCRIYRNPKSQPRTDRLSTPSWLLSHRRTRGFHQSQNPLSTTTGTAINRVNHAAGGILATGP